MLFISLLRPSGFQIGSVFWGWFALELSMVSFLVRRVKEGYWKQLGLLMLLCVTLMVLAGQFEIVTREVGIRVISSFVVGFYLACCALVVWGMNEASRGSRARYGVGGAVWVVALAPVIGGILVESVLFDGFLALSVGGLVAVGIACSMDAVLVRYAALPEK
jgi:hypothetical protein